MAKASLPILDLLPICPDHDVRPLVIAGPCSAESRAQVLQTARALSREGIVYYRAGVWKPRTYPGGFEGVGVSALPWLTEVQETLGMRVVIEVASAEHVRAAIDAGIRHFWIGARTTSSPFALEQIGQSLGGEDVTIFVKNPIAPDLDLWIGALSRLNKYGVKRLAAINRGFGMGSRTIYRNVPMWRIALRLMQAYPHLPVLCDPSHISGRRDLIGELSQEAMDRCYTGLIIESHCNPDDAWSDAAQQVTPNELSTILQQLRVGSCDPCQGEDIDRLRHQIDEIDDEIIRLLGDRCRLAEEIAHWKYKHQRTALQADRYETMLQDRLRRADRYHVPHQMLSEVYEAIHDGSLKIQTECIDQITDDSES